MTLAFLTLLLAAAPSEARSGDPPGWKRIDVPAAGFSAAFPGVPTRSQAPVQLSGHAARARTFVLDRAGVRWAVGVTELGSEFTKEKIEWLTQSAALFQQNVVRSTPVRRQGRRAWEVEYRNGRGSSLALYVAGDDRMFQAIVAVEDGSVPKEGRAFLDGFRLIPVVSPPPAPPPRPVDRWEEYAPEGARFAARFPAQPDEQPGETEDGVPTRAFVAEQEGVLYSVFVMPITAPGERARAIVDAVVEEARAEIERSGFAGRPVVGAPGSVSGMPSRDLIFETNDAAMFMRVIAAPDRLFRIGVAATAGPMGAGRERFLDSFRVLPR